MALPALVLVHGGGLAADCWDLTVAEINRLAPDLMVLALDMPGRRTKPADLREITIADYVDSLVADIESAGVDELIIVGHSMAGALVPTVVTRLGAPRVREMILAAAFIPPEGRTLADMLEGPAARLARRYAKSRAIGRTPWWLVRFAFLNGVPRAGRQFMSGKVYVESTRILGEKVSRYGMPDEIPRTWIFASRDRAISRKTQQRCMEALGGVQTLISLETCHCMMVSEPRRLAEVLVERCRLYV